MTSDLGKQAALPSRDAVDEALTFAPLTDAAADPIYDIARAYVHGGRLVDRKTIDAWIAKHRYGPGDWVVDDAALDAFAAAIGDTE